MSGAGVDIVSAEVEPPQELRVRHTYTVELPDAEALPELMRAMLRVPGVYDVYRAGPGGRGNGDDHGGEGVRPSRGMRGGSAALSSSGDPARLPRRELSRE
jgi:hypothetical protein